MLTGRKIARLRTEANLTQEQLAEKLYITRELVSKWETGKRHPDYRMILKIAEIFNVKAEDIFSKSDSLLKELSDIIPDKYNQNTAELTAVLNTFLDRLSIRDRSVFIRRYYFFEDVSVIAEEYKIKESNVRTVLMRTRKKLKKYFKEG
ncbi:MAG: helix-turn-helix domain-containing protein [Lachnospiraceae bacterium]|nr:helix-turn-helix domain-containing protein [Lachnospiraceae bacterium]MCM1230847.1 helix-turn-helix domain-containing protein [Ruminococcus flavefaciens]